MTNKIELVPKGHCYINNDIVIGTEKMNSIGFTYDRVKNLDLYFNNSQGYGDQVEFLNFTPFRLRIRTINGPTVTIEPEKIAHADADGCLVIRHGIRADRFQKNEIRENNSREGNYFKNVRYNEYDYLLQERPHNKSSAYEIGALRFDAYSYNHYFYTAEYIVDKINSSKSNKMVVGKPFFIEVALEVDPLISTSNPLDHHNVVSEASSRHIEEVKRQFVKYDGTSFQIVINDKTNTIGKRFTNMFGKIVEIDPVSNECEEEGISVYVTKIKNNKIDSKVKTLEGFPQGLDYISEENGFYKSKKDCIDGHDTAIIKRKYDAELVKMKLDFEEVKHQHEAKMAEFARKNEEAINNHKLIISNDAVTISNNNRTISELKTKIERLISKNNETKTELEQSKLEYEKVLSESSFRIQKNEQEIKRLKIALEEKELQFKEIDLKFKQQDRKDEREFKEKERKFEFKTIRNKGIIEFLKLATAVVSTGAALYLGCKKLIGFIKAYSLIPKPV